MTWRLAHALDQLRAEVEARWPGTTVWTIGDDDHAARASDHNPNADGVVCAIDVLDDGRGQAAAVWQLAAEGRDPRLHYAIHAGRIVSATTSPWKVRDYTGTNPHDRHVHVSVGRGHDGAKRAPELYDDPAPWGLTDVPDDEPASSTSWPTEVVDAMETLDLSDVTASASTWLRGEAVARLQALLAAAGVPPARSFTPRGRPDGIGGPSTRKALATYQGRNPATGTGGQPDAIAGRRTWSALLDVS